jgi:riboflavin kinase / FMN adenylyltransferase
MNVYHHTFEAAGKIKNAVVTTGSFDGVHIGHKLIINRLNEIAREIEGESVLITFYPHPRKVLYPDQKDLRLINSQEEKIELLRKAGLDNLIIIPFSIDFSKTTSRDFVVDMLIDHLNAKVIVVGHNHHFGHARQGDYSYLDALSREFDFEVEEIPLKLIENETVSSTKIRKALKEGNIQRANAYLDHQYILKGKLYEGKCISPHPDQPILGIEIPEAEKLIPPPGIYACNLLAEGQWLKSMTFVIEMPGNIRQIENLLIYDKLMPSGQTATLYFHKMVWAGNPANNGEMNANVLEEAREMVEDLIY